MNLKGKKIILGSASPRRQQLLKELFPEVEVRVKHVHEDFPKNLTGADIPLFLCRQKADAFKGELMPDEILITADTVVWFDNHVLNKPADRAEALQMLQKLSGNAHQVFTGVCIATAAGKKVFSVESKVRFKKLKQQELLEYIDQYKPYDKAGAYGAQECLPAGMNPLSEKERNFLIEIGKPDLFETTRTIQVRIPLIEKIEGSYFNVMGLPVVELWENLQS